MNALKFALMGALMLPLSGCLTMHTQMAYKSTEVRQHTIVKDAITAVAKPKTPIPNHEGAMVLVGQQHSFLVKPYLGDSPYLFNQIFDKVDLSHLYITFPSNKDSQRVFDLNVYQNQKNPTSAINMVHFSFVKPTKNVKTSEQKTLTDLGFRCETGTLDNQEYLVCKTEVRSQFIVAEQVRNAKDLPYQFKEPLTLHFYSEEQYEKTRPQYMLLMPLALAIDVVMVPIAVPLGVVGLGVVGVGCAIEPGPCFKF